MIEKFFILEYLRKIEVPMHFISRNLRSLNLFIFKYSQQIIIKENTVKIRIINLNVILPTTANISLVI